MVFLFPSNARQRAVPLAVAALLLASTICSAAPLRPTILVRPVAWRGGDAQKGMTDLLTEQLMVRLHQSERFDRVTSLKDVEATLELEQRRQLADCDAASCFAEIAAALGATYLLMGTVGRLGDSYQISFRVLSPARVAIEAVAARSVPVGQESRLTEAVDDMTEELLRRLFKEAVPQHPETTSIPRRATADAPTDGPYAAEETGSVEAPTGTQTTPALVVRGLTGVGVALVVPTLGCLLCSHVACWAGLGTMAPTFGSVGFLLAPLGALLGLPGMALAVVHAGVSVATPVLVAALRRGQFTTMDRVLTGVWLIGAAATLVAALPLMAAGATGVVAGAAWAINTGGANAVTYSVEPGYAVALTGASLALSSGWLVVMGLAGLVAGATTAVLGENVLDL